MIHNLHSLWDQAAPDDITEGIRAYGRYHATLRGFADYYGFELQTTVEAFAALSPNNDYKGNLRSLASVLQHVRNDCKRPYTVSTYRACAERAITYLTGEVNFLSKVKGMKITAFRHNLIYPLTSRKVTVDGHMYAAYVGKRLTMKEAALELGRGKTKYNEVAQAITTVAREHNILPCEAQAVLWITRKRVNAIKFNAQKDLFLDSTDLGRALARPEEYLPYPVKGVD